MCCCPGKSCAEIALFILGFASFLLSIPGIFYSAVFWLFATAFSAGQGWFMGVPFLVMFCLLLATGILEAFFGSGVCCPQPASCRKCTLKAAIVLRALVMLTLIFTLVFFSNLHLFYGQSTYVTAPPFPPNAAPTPPPPWPAWPPHPPSPPKLSPDMPPFPPNPTVWPPNPPLYPTDYVDNSGLTVLIVWMVIIFAKLLITLVLDVVVMRQLANQPADGPPQAVAFGVPVSGGVQMQAPSKA